VNSAIHVASIHGNVTPHTTISELQKKRAREREANGQGKSSSTIDQELGYIVDDFRAAGYSDAVTGKVLEQQYRMLDKLGVNYSRAPGF
jgi:hypothetical protein